MHTPQIDKYFPRCRFCRGAAREAGIEGHGHFPAPSFNGAYLITEVVNSILALIVMANYTGLSYAMARAVNIISITIHAADPHGTHEAQCPLILVHL